MGRNRFIVAKTFNKLEMISLFMVGVVAGATLLATVRHFDTPHTSVAVNINRCTACHFNETPRIKTLKQYKASIKQGLTSQKQDKALLVELAKP